MVLEKISYNLYVILSEVLKAFMLSKQLNFCPTPAAPVELMLLYIISSQKVKIRIVDFGPKGTAYERLKNPMESKQNCGQTKEPI